MTYTLNLTQEQIMLIDQALSVRPYSEVAALFAVIQQQITEQEQAIQSAQVGEDG